MTPVTDKSLAGIIDDPTGVNSNTVLAIAIELQAFREAGTPLDVQQYILAALGTFPIRNSESDADYLALVSDWWFRKAVKAMACTGKRVKP